MDLWKSLSGMIAVELTSACVEETLESISRRGISVYQVKRKNDLTVTFSILRRDWYALSEMSQKRGETLQIIRRAGFFWTAKHMSARPVLLVGILTIIFGTMWIPRHVMFVQVEGNTSIPTCQILESAEKCGICFGATRSLVRSEQVKNELLSLVPELQWAGVNTRGCVAVISVREKTVENKATEKPAVSSIVASRDGIVTDCTAVRGTLLCAPGQAVQQGEVLISGYTDCGISIRAASAEGEIYAETQRQLRAITPIQWQRRTRLIRGEYSLSLLAGKKRINLWKDSGIWDTTCDRMYTEYYVILPGGFRLPLALCVEVCQMYETDIWKVSKDHASDAFRIFAQTYLSQQMIAGKILSQQDSVSAENDLYVFCGSYLCSEMIGRVQAEEIGDQYGKAD